MTTVTQKVASPTTKTSTSKPKPYKLRVVEVPALKVSNRYLVRNPVYGDPVIYGTGSGKITCGSAVCGPTRFDWLADRLHDKVYDNLLANTEEADLLPFFAVAVKEGVFVRGRNLDLWVARQNKFNINLCVLDYVNQYPDAKHIETKEDLAEALGITIEEFSRGSEAVAIKFEGSE